MEDNVFRAPNEPTVEDVAVKEPKSDKQPEEVRDDGKTPPSLRTELRQTPLFLELMEVPHIYEQFNIKELAGEIDGFINERNSGDDEKSYQEEFDRLFKASKATGDPYTIVSRLAEYIKVQRKLYDAVKEKEEFELKDPMEMTSKELKRWLNLQANNKIRS